MLGAIFGPRSNLGADFVELIHGLTEGNPFFVEETLKALMVAGDLVPRDGGWRAQSLERVRVPRTAIEAVRRRIATLTVPARSVASIAAVTGRRFDFELLRTLTDVDEDELLALVKELIAAQLVVEETGERFAFRHALTREAIYADLLVRERVALHRAVAVGARAYARRCAGRAWSRRSRTTRRRRAIGHARRSMRRARHVTRWRSPPRARRWASSIVRSRRRRKPAITVSVELLLARGWANETLAEFDRAREDFTSALERARVAGDQRSAWEALHALGMLWAARDYSRAGDYRRDALTVARTIGDDVLVARSLNRVGNWHVNLDEPRAGLPHHEEALALFERLGDQRGVTETVDLLAVAHQIARRSARGGDVLRALDRAVHGGGRSARARQRARAARAVRRLRITSPGRRRSRRRERRTRSPRHSRSDSRARSGGAPASRSCASSSAMHSRGAASTIARCRWRAKRSIWRSRSAISSGPPPRGGCSAARCSTCCAPELAREQLEAAHEIARTLGSRVWIRWTAGPLAMARMRTGDVAGAEELLDTASCAADGTAGAPADAPTLTLGERQLWLARAELAVATQRPERALEIADARLAVERAANANSVLGVPRLTLVRANALLALERFDEATSTLDTAREEATRQGARPLLWRIEAADGQVHRARRERLEARQAFDRASAIADELALKIEDEELRAEFLKGVASFIPSAPSPSAAQIAKAEADGLTRRERDVARLVALGKANKVIAHDLGIGERTVEGYVTSALAKLGFDSRARLAAWAVTKGLAEPAHPVQIPRAD